MKTKAELSIFIQQYFTFSFTVSLLLPYNKLLTYLNIDVVMQNFLVSFLSFIEITSNWQFSTSRNKTREINKLNFNMWKLITKEERFYRLLKMFEKITKRKIWNSLFKWKFYFSNIIRFSILQLSNLNYV